MRAVGKVQKAFPAFRPDPRSYGLGKPWPSCISVPTHVLGALGAIVLHGMPPIRATVCPAFTEIFLLAAITAGIMGGGGGEMGCKPGYVTRAKARGRVDLEAVLVAAGGRPLEARIRDLSPAGFLAECAEPLPIGTSITVHAPAFGRAAAQVRWALGCRIGARFEGSLATCTGLSIETLTEVERGEDATPWDSQGGR